MHFQTLVHRWEFQSWRLQATKGGKIDSSCLRPLCVKWLGSLANRNSILFFPSFLRGMWPGLGLDPRYFSSQKLRTATGRWLSLAPRFQTPSKSHSWPRSLLFKEFVAIQQNPLRCWLHSAGTCKAHVTHSQDRQPLREHLTSSCLHALPTNLPRLPNMQNTNLGGKFLSSP